MQLYRPQCLCNTTEVGEATSGLKTNSTTKVREVGIEAIMEAMVEVTEVREDMGEEVTGTAAIVIFETGTKVVVMVMATKVAVVDTIKATRGMGVTSTNSNNSIKEDTVEVTTSLNINNSDSIRTKEAAVEVTTLPVIVATGTKASID